MNCKSTVILLVLFYFCFQSLAQENENRWWPSKYGAGDQRGAANLLTPEKVLETNKLIQQGKIYTWSLKNWLTIRYMNLLSYLFQYHLRELQGPPGNPIAIK